MNSYNNKNHNNSINNNYNKTNSTKSGFDLIVISLVQNIAAYIARVSCQRYFLNFDEDFYLSTNPHKTKTML